MIRLALAVTFLVGAITALVLAANDVCDTTDTRVILGAAGSGACLGGAAWALVGLLSNRAWVAWATGIAVALVGGFLVLVLLFAEWVNQCTA